LDRAFGAAADCGQPFELDRGASAAPKIVLLNTPA